jgi:hypothetical protein
MVLADFASYLDCQKEAGHAYRDPERWTRMAIQNVARMGKFSSDRAIREYCEEIWQVKPVPVPLNNFGTTSAAPTKRPAAPKVRRTKPPAKSKAPVQKRPAGRKAGSGEFQ